VDSPWWPIARCGVPMTMVRELGGLRLASLVLQPHLASRLQLVIRIVGATWKGTLPSSVAGNGDGDRYRGWYWSVVPAERRPRTSMAR
jgi:hypothetical protein